MRDASRNSCLWSFSVFTIDSHQVKKVEEDIERVPVDLRVDDEDDNNDDDDIMTMRMTMTFKLTLRKT